MHIGTSSFYQCLQAHYIKNSSIMLEFGLQGSLLPELVLTLLQAREVLESIAAAEIPSWKKELTFEASGNIPSLCAEKPVRQCL